MTEDRKQAIAAVFDRSAPTYDRVGVEFFAPIGRDLVAAAGVRPGEHVLDVGCGRGAVLAAARDAVAPSGSVTGIDLAPTMVALTRDDFAGDPLVTVAIGDAEDPDFAPGTFDVVLAGLVLFFLPDLPAALRRYRALVRPGGRLGLTTFGPSDPHFDAAMDAIGQFIPGRQPDRGARQGRLETPDGIAAVLAENGWPQAITVNADYVSRFADAEHWARWAWSHGGRATLEQVPESARDDALAAGMAVIAAADDGDGLVIRSAIRITTATAA